MRWMSWMFVEILAFIFYISGWVLVASTLATDYWKIATLDGVVLATVVNFSNLWKICVTDFIGVSDCKDFPSLLALDGILQACRALMVTAICLGFFGCTFALIGMKCTKIGGTGKSKSRIGCLAGATFLLSGLSSMSACSLYAHQITTQFFDPMFVELKYDFGVALFIGWSGSFLCIVGGSMLCIASYFSKSHRKAKYIHNSTASHSHISSYPRGQAKSINQRPPSNYSNSSRMQRFDKNAYV